MTSGQYVVSIAERAERTEQTGMAEYSLPEGSVSAAHICKSCVTLRVIESLCRWYNNIFVLPIMGAEADYQSVELSKEGE